MRKINLLYRGALRLDVDKPERASLRMTTTFENDEIWSKNPHFTD
jgi:hypothetical protein